MFEFEERNEMDRPLFYADGREEEEAGMSTDVGLAVITPLEEEEEEVAETSELEELYVNAGALRLRGDARRKSSDEDDFEEEEAESEEGEDELEEDFDDEEFEDDEFDEEDEDVEDDFAEDDDI